MDRKSARKRAGRGREYPYYANIFHSLPPHTGRCTMDIFSCVLMLFQEATAASDQRQCFEPSRREIPSEWTVVASSLKVLCRFLNHSPLDRLPCPYCSYSRRKLLFQLAEDGRMSLTFSNTFMILSLGNFWRLDVISPRRIRPSGRVLSFKVIAGRTNAIFRQLLLPHHRHCCDPPLRLTCLYVQHMCCKILPLGSTTPTHTG